MQHPIPDPTAQVPALEPIGARGDAPSSVFLAMAMAIVFGAPLFATTGAATPAVVAESAATFLIAA